MANTRPSPLYKPYIWGWREEDRDGEEELHQISADSHMEGFSMAVPEDRKESVATSTQDADCTVVIE